MAVVMQAFEWQREIATNQINLCLLRIKIYWLKECTTKEPERDKKQVGSGVYVYIAGLSLRTTQIELFEEKHPLNSTYLFTGACVT